MNKAIDKHITLISLKRLSSIQNPLLVDVRSPVDYNNYHLPNSINVPLRRISELIKLDKTRNLVVISDKDDPDLTNIVHRYISDMGFTKIFVTTDLV